jgi:hypothetical protein
MWIAKSVSSCSVHLKIKLITRNTTNLDLRSSTESVSKRLASEPIVEVVHSGTISFLHSFYLKNLFEMNDDKVVLLVACRGVCIQLDRSVPISDSSKVISSRYMMSNAA